MALLALSPAADRDVAEVLSYLRRAAGSSKAMDFVSALESTGQLLTHMPKTGRIYRRTRTGVQVRVFPVSRFPAWLLFYEVVEDSASTVIFVHRLLHGSRDIETALD